MQKIKILHLNIWRLATKNAQRFSIKNKQENGRYYLNKIIRLNVL